MDRKKYFRAIPKVDGILMEGEIQILCDTLGRGFVLDVTRRELDRLRRLVQTGTEEEIVYSLEHFLDGLPETIREEAQLPLRRVYNGTGIILHTNLGRAPLGESQIQAALQAMAGYSNLEYDLKAGRRGKRSSHFADLAQKVTGAEAAIAVNNNAAAVTLALSAMARGREVILSRGELIEIGGRFRIPEVMEQSGAVLRETGTTNRTRISDYEKAVSPETGALMKVHTSNYKILGFTQEASVEELAELGKRWGLPVIVDLGSGVLVNLEKYGLAHEPTVQEVLARGADVVCFSGDKLLGGMQAGVIVGKKKYVKLMEEHPLMRAFRLDKCSIAVLAATFREYLDPELAQKRLPVLRMLSRRTDELQAQAESLRERLEGGKGGDLEGSGQQDQPGLQLEGGRAENPEEGFSGPAIAGKPGKKRFEIHVERCASQVGGGSLPGEELSSFALTICPLSESCEALAERLRKCRIPVIGYVKNDRFWLDMRTILPEETDGLGRELEHMLWVRPVP